MEKIAIDAVIAWVDGNDENHAKKLAQYVENKASLSQKGFVTRFNQVNEIEYCVRSIRKFAPFVNIIYIVTDNQIPSFILENKNHPDFKNIKIIDHKTIFAGFENYLPTFNCYPIETMLYRIPDLAERFIYFNDDMFLINPTKVSDFFDTNGFPVLRGQWKSMDKTVAIKDFLIKIGLKKKRLTKLGYKKAQENAASLLGLQRYFKLDHTPFPIRKTVFEQYFKENPSHLIQNIQHKFRNPDFYMVQSHAAHLELLTNTCTCSNDYSLVNFGSTEKSKFWISTRLFFAKRIHKKLFLNIQSMDLYSTEKVKFIAEWLDKNNIN
jgi:hypothetical protein